MARIIKRPLRKKGPIKPIKPFLRKKNGNQNMQNSIQMKTLFKMDLED